MMRIEHDIFDLIGGGDKYHSAILTCFSFDPIFFSTFYLPNLRSAGARNVIVLVDSSNYDAAIEGYLEYGSLVQDMKCNLVRMTPTSTGVFHPKIVMLLGKTDAMVAVGSGNLTYSGYVKNDEIWGTFQIYGDSSSNYPILNQVWTYISNILPENEAIEKQISWIRENSPFIKTAEDNTDEFVHIDAKSRACFVGNQGPTSIYSKVKDVIGDSAVKRIKVISPFYDNTAFLNQLQKDYAPEDLSIVYDKMSPMLPSKVSEHWRTFSWEHEGRRLHGKAYQFETELNNVFVLGSANATKAAWGNESSYSNDEACLIIVSEAKEDYFSLLGIDFDKETEIDQEQKRGYPIPILPDISFKTHILSCIYNEEGAIELKLDNDVKEATLICMDGQCRHIKSLQVSSVNCIINANVEAKTTIKIVALTQNDVTISNKCLALNSQILANMNPNEQNRKLDSLLDSSPDWKVDIVEILSYAGYHTIRWDEVGHKASEVKQARKRTGASDASDKTISREDFEHVLLDVGMESHTAANMKIADFLNATLHDSSLNTSEVTADETYGQADIERGIEADSESDVIKARKQETAYSVIKALITYCKRVESSYDKALDRMGYNALGVPEGLDYEPTLYDYSILATLSICAFYGQIHSEEGEVFDWQNFLLRTSSKFFLIFKNGYALGNGYSFRKMQEFQQDSIVYILLTLARYVRTRYFDSAELLVLNIIEALPKEGTVTKESIFKAFTKRIDQQELPYSTEAVDRIKAIFEYYDALYEDVVEIRDSDSKMLGYKKSIGFFYFDNIRKRYISGDHCGYTYSCHHPAFDAGVLTFQCMSKIKVKKKIQGSDS